MIDDKHIIVNYHYVENPREDFSGIYPCSIDEFEKQIRFLSEHFAIVNIQDVFKAAQNGASEKLCAITFDDGLKDQYENAISVLEKYNVAATFFLITSTFEGNIPATHKLHFLLSQKPAKDLVDESNKFLKKPISKDYRLSLTRKLSDDVLTANFKEAMSTFPKETVENCLTGLFKNFGFDEKEIGRDFFMDSLEIKNLEKRGFLIGSHGHSHYALDFQDIGFIRNDIFMSKKRIEEILQHQITLFSYPHGGFNNEIADVLKEEGFSHAVTIERAGVKSSSSPFSIPRYDTNDLRDFIYEKA